LKFGREMMENGDAFETRCKTLMGAFIISIEIREMN